MNLNLHAHNKNEITEKCQSFLKERVLNEELQVN